MKRGEHVAALDWLRVLAAFWVALYHFTDAPELRNGYPVESGLTLLGRHGYLGLYIFFVVSGFVMPLAMERSGYRWGDFPRFMAKRFLRLWPLYFASVVGVTAWLWPNVQWADWWPHLIHGNDLMGRSWLISIYWTLAIEMQFYILLGVLYPWLKAGPRWRQWVVLGVYVGVSLLDWSSALVFRYGAFFGCGMVVQRWHANRAEWPAALAGLAACGAVLWHLYHPIHMSVALATSGAILVVRWRHPVISFLGAISYSFYLVHSMAGGYVGVFMAGLPRVAWRDGLGVMMALGVSVLAAWGLHVALERPSLRWARRVRYRVRND
jgi:peptidoglycan/LPS O-acetylase OafA/YrhL